MATVKVPEGAHDPEEVESSANTQKETETGTEPTNAHGSKNPSYNVDKENVQGNDNPSQQPDESEVKKLALHMGLPPAKVPLTTVASTLHQFTLYRTSKEKWIANIRVNTGFVAFTRINTGLVVYTRIITDSTRIFDRGRLSGPDTMSLLVYIHRYICRRGEITGVSLRHSTPLQAAAHRLRRHC